MPNRSLPISIDAETQHRYFSVFSEAVLISLAFFQAGRFLCIPLGPTFGFLIDLGLLSIERAIVHILAKNVTQSLSSLSAMGQNPPMVPYDWVVIHIHLPWMNIHKSHRF